MSAAPTVKMGPFIGTNNRLPDTKLRTKDGAWLRSAVNVDINSAGMVKRRPGIEQAVSGSDCHSFWSNALGTQAYYVDYDTLYSIGGPADAPVKTAIFSGLTPGIPLSYCEANADVYFSNGIVIKRIAGGVVKPAALPTPAFLPLISVTTGGGLKAGKYGLTFTYQSADGEEGGATTPVQLDVPENGSILLSAFPAEEVYINVYVTPLNGDQYYLAATLPSYTAAHVIPLTPPQGRRCQTMLLAPMPPGSTMRHYNGRLITAVSGTLTYSEPWSPLTNPAKNYMAFPENITVVQPCNNGVYIAAEQTYWAPGDLASSDLNPVLPYGGVHGTGGDIPNENACFWMSPRGMVKGTQDGQVSNLQEAANVVESYVVGAPLFRESDGLKQMLVSSFGTASSSVFAAQSWMTADVSRKETAL